MVFPEFNRKDCIPLMTSEVHACLEQIHQLRTAQGHSTAAFQHTMEYAQRFSNVKSKEMAAEIRGLLQDKQLHKFEQATLGSLFPESAEEAKALIPSLGERMEDLELEELIQEIQNFRNTFRE